jgi:hypothetical protein
MSLVVFVSIKREKQKTFRARGFPVGLSVYVFTTSGEEFKHWINLLNSVLSSIVISFGTM